jgi:hypothetical protein
MQVRELIEMLQPFPGEMRVAFTVELLNGKTGADSVELLRREDVVELKVSGALAWKDPDSHWPR